MSDPLRSADDRSLRHAVRLTLRIVPKIVSSDIPSLTATARKRFTYGNICRVGGDETLVTDKLIAPDVFSRLQQATASQPGQLVELCREYLTEARQTLAQLRKAFTLKQADELRNRAHYLRGSSMLVGATRVTRCCASLEAMGKNADFSQTEQETEEMSAALDAVQQELVKTLGSEVLPATGSAV